MPDPQRLLAWYDRHRRTLPWRALPGEVADPYRVWLSEVMLQQTTVATVKPYFDRFVAQWPTVAALAAAPLEDVLKAWAGLGYYARARNLHACSKAVVERHGGAFPEEADSLRALPGIGDYTAAAIQAIAFGRKATPVDGNFERVVARLFAIAEPLPGVKSTLRRLAEEITPEHRPGDWAQAMMDLGAMTCTPAKPRCVLCPFRDECRAAAQGIAEDLPRRAPKKAKPTRRGIAFVTFRDDEVLLRRRSEKGLLGGMLEAPSTEWREAAWTTEEALAFAPANGKWRALPGIVRHTFTHFHLELGVMVAEAASGEGLWVPVERLGGEALPSVMHKVLERALTASPRARAA